MSPRLMVVMLFVALSLVSLGLSSDEQTQASKRQLEFHQDGTFKVVQFTDVHLGSGTRDDEQSKIGLRQIIDTEHPDLVLITGDSIAANRPDGDGCLSDEGREAACWKILVSAMVETSTPWAMTVSLDTSGITF